MGESRFAWAFVGTLLLLVSCGGGQSGTSGNGGGGAGGAAGSGGAAGAGTGGAAGQSAGTGGSGATCPSVAPCGGNIVGTWKVTQSCVSATDDFSNAGAGCTGANAVLEIAYGGTITYGADLSFDASAVTANEVVHEYFPSGCSPFGLTCQQLGQTATDAGSRCSIDAQGACNCDTVMMLTSDNPTGTYSVSGSKVTSSSPNGMPSMSSYCVQGNLLYLIPDSTGDGGLIASGEIVLARQ